MALTKVNSVGIATGISLTGITTTQDAKIGTGITLSPDGHGYYTGIVTATSYRGDVSNCTGVGQTNFIDAESLNVSGISTFTGNATVGTGITLSPDGDVYVTGISTFVKDVNIVADINIADYIVHTGDTNTKFGFAAADTITANTAGSERLRIDDNGRVIIGDSGSASPTGILHIYQASNDPYIYIQRGSGDAANAIGGIVWKNNTNNLGQIVVNSTDINDSNMAFKTMLAGTLTEAFRIDNNGRLLIGTTDIDSVSDGEVPKLISKGTDSTAGAAFVRHSADAAGCGLYLAKSRNATIGSNTIVQSGDELGRITFSGDDGTNLNTQGAQIAAHVDGTPGSNDMPGRLSFYTTADNASAVTERLRIDSAGAVILSATFNSNTDISPALVIGSSSFSRPGIVIRGNSTNKGDISFCDNSGSDSSDGVSEGLIRYDHDGDYMCFHAADEERFRLLATGYAEFAGASDIRVTFGSQGTAGTNDANWIRADGQNLMYNNAGTGGAHKWEVGGSEKMRLAGDGEVFIGDGIGTADRSTLLSISGTNQNPASVWTQVGLYSNDSQGADYGGSIGFGGQDGSTTKQQFAAIKGAKENATSGNYAGYLAFYTRPNGAVTHERMRIHSDGGFRLWSGANAYEAVDILHNADAGNGTTAITPVTQPGSGAASQYIYLKNKGSGSGSTSMNLIVDGALSKGSGSFRIPHPLPALKDTKELLHSFIEGPQCDNIYRGKVTLSSGTATVNLDTVSNMTDGTFVVLNRDIQCFTSNETGWDAVKGSVSGNVLTITSQNNSSTDTISWMVVGERQDPNIKESVLTDDDGYLIVEADKGGS